MANTTKHRYIESHWLIFVVKGILALLAGIILTVIGGNDSQLLTRIVGFTMLGLSIVEIFNVVHRKRLERNWGMSLAIGAIEMIMALVLLFTINQAADEGWMIAIRAIFLMIYMCAVSALQILIGLKCFKNATDRYIWISSGVIGCVLGLITLVFMKFGDAAHIRVFGCFLGVKGITDMFFGGHSRSELMQTVRNKARGGKKTARENTGKSTEKTDTTKKSGGKN